MRASSLATKAMPQFYASRKLHRNAVYLRLVSCRLTAIQQLAGRVSATGRPAWYRPGQLLFPL